MALRDWARTTAPRGWRAALLLGVACSAAPGDGALLAAGDRPPLEVALLVDTSGSIGRKLEATRNRLAAEVAKSLPAGSGISVFAFDDEPRLLLARTTKPGEVEGAVSGLKSRGRFTALNDAVFDAVRTLAQGPEGRRAIVVISDGLDENSALLAEDGMNAAREQRIPVFCLGIGNVQERYLRRMAKLTGGEYFAPRTEPGRVVARLAEATPVAQPIPPPAVPPQQAAAPPLPAAPAATGATPVPGSVPAVVTETAPLWPAVLALAVVVAATVVVIAVLGRRRAGGAEAAAAAPGEPQAAAAEDDTIVGRADLVEPSQPTLVLTLKPLLHVTKGPNMGRFFEIKLLATTSIGRAKGNEVVLDDRAVSGQHCRIRPSGGLWEIFDLKSTNGTFVNERKIVRHPLTAGDQIKVGETVMQFRMDHVKGAPAA